MIDSYSHLEWAQLNLSILLGLLMSTVKPTQLPKHLSQAFQDCNGPKIFMKPVHVSLVDLGSFPKVSLNTLSMAVLPSSGKVLVPMAVKFKVNLGTLDDRNFCLS